MTIVDKPKQLRGLALVSPERRREIASKGGLTVQRNGTAHLWTAEEAQIFGRKGGRASRRGKSKKGDDSGTRS